jgi:hypothetical protein
MRVFLTGTILALSTLFQANTLDAQPKTPQPTIKKISKSRIKLRSVL